jgi:3-phenylpropionate/trans-cinnamate dioxygenase ferredoxin reductase component
VPDHTVSTAPVASVVVVGGGLAGLSTAQELRRRGFGGPVTLVDREGIPYDRPPLSKAYLQPGAAPDSLLLVEAQWYAENDIEVMTGEVAAIEPATTTVVLTDGRSIRADRIVLATGGLPRSLAVPGAADAGVLHLRGRADAERVRAQLGPGRRLLVVGAGLIGAELASTAVAQGTEVVLVDPVETPLAAAVGEELATRLHAMHADAGVTCVVGAVESVVRTGDGVLATVRRTSEARLLPIACDAIVVAVGGLPDTALAEAAGLHVDGGVLVDDRQRTSDPRVLAVGDAARHLRPDGTLDPIHEHWDSAAADGRRAAAAILDQDPAPRAAPWFWSDRYGVHVEVAGSMTGPGEVAVRDQGDGGWAAFRIENGKLVGCAAVDATAVVRAARRLIDRGSPVTSGELTGPGDLRRLVRR